MSVIRRKRISKEKDFSVDYKPVIIALIILVILIILLILVILYNPDSGKNTHIDKEHQNYINVNLEENVLDSSECTTDDDGPADAQKINFTYKLEDNVYLGKSRDLNACEFGDITCETGDDAPEIDVYGEGFDIEFSNITENTRVYMSNDTNDDVVNINYSDTDKGVYHYHTTDVDDIIRYFITIYSTKDECKDVPLRKFEVLMPMFNEFSKLAVCENNDNKLCDQLVTEHITIREFYISINSENKKMVNVDNIYDENDTDDNVEYKNVFERIILFIIKYKLYFIIGIIGIILLVIIKFIYRWKKYGK